MNLFKRKPVYLGPDDLQRLIKLSDELIKHVNEAYPLDSNDEITNRVTESIRDARLHQIEIFKDAFKQLEEEYFRREMPFLLELKEAFKE